MYTCSLHFILAILNVDVTEHVLWAVGPSL